MRGELVSYSQPTRFVRLDSEHAQSDGKSVNRGLPVLELPRVQHHHLFVFMCITNKGEARSRFLLLTKRSAASEDENGLWRERQPLMRAESRGYKMFDCYGVCTEMITLP